MSRNHHLKVYYINQVSERGWGSFTVFYEITWKDKSQQVYKGSHELNLLEDQKKDFTVIFKNVKNTDYFIDSNGVQVSFKSMFSKLVKLNQQDAALVANIVKNSSTAISSFDRNPNSVTFDLHSLDVDSLANINKLL